MKKCPKIRAFSPISLLSASFCLTQVAKIAAFFKRFERVLVEFKTQESFDLVLPFCSISQEIHSSPSVYFGLKLLVMARICKDGSPFPWLRELKSEERGLWLIHLLLACANHVAGGNTESANIGLERISQLASTGGDAVQRIAAYFSEALAVRLVKGWPGLHKAMNSTKPSLKSDDILVQRLFFELCPFLKLTYVITNQAIMEAMEGEKAVHIIDLNPFEPPQWINLLQTLSVRPGGPPQLRITGVHEQKEVLEHIGLRLTEEADKLGVPFQFNPIVSKLEDLDLENMPVNAGEALAVSAVLKLHTLLATEEEMHSRKSSSASNNRTMKRKQLTLGEWLEKDSTNVYSRTSGSALAATPKLWRFLSALCDLSPKLMVVMEQESNHNGVTLMERVTEALNFYAAMFDCLESTTSRVASLERQKVEKWMFGEEIKNIIACEGIERKERHEKVEQWILRLESAGLGKVPLSIHGMLQGTGFLRSYGYDGYKIRENNGRFVICWHERPLFSLSAWRSKSYYR